MRLHDPSIIVMPSYFHVPTANDDEDCYVPVQWLQITSAMREAFHPNVKFGGRRPYEWEEIVTPRIALGHGILIFPPCVSNDSPFIPDQPLVVVNSTTNDSITCTVTKADLIGPHYHCAYFLRSLKLKANDKLKFVLDNPPKVLVVKVVRNCRL
ncbi:hypothetical protein TSUD_219450 [Trifolium subterraneum]|uniref:Uncharacterized protein n=1 Tax=Trifolium subterraneum TaxID=3900 RepID=A0A2Z6NWF5_TRISU|nr:hypothetical protein TSUD_219450 [Trifolium subterraneum]